MNHHLKAIRSGFITKTNVIGLRKALAADDRRRSGYSVSRVAPKLCSAELDDTIAALIGFQPRVIGDLHESGLRQLRLRRYARRWTVGQQFIIDNLLRFHLVRFDRVRFNGVALIVPVYKAVGGIEREDYFLFRNVAWQSGGNGPEIVQ